MNINFDKLTQSGQFGSGRDPAYLANLFLRLVRDLRTCTTPPREIPADQRDAFTMNGEMEVREIWRDDTILRIVSERDPAELAKLSLLVYERAYVDSLVAMVRKSLTFQYGVTDRWLYAALKNFPVRDTDVAILGSGSPVYESITLAHGGRPLTVEYQPRISDHPDLTFMSPDEFVRSGQKVDAALSISSFEHDGLGRYGDPLDPNGDLKAMANLKSQMKPGGKLFLAVPNGKDVLMWNVNRIYGAKRMPMLVDGWRCVAAYGPPPGVLTSLDPFVIDEDAWNNYFATDESCPHWLFVLEA
ncbi:MAG: DUF268 domain-containing protein [Rhodospirillaceae bacterium]|nr:DUF268 domain-containing protein [Rhodospirillales bacterium]